MRVAATPLAGGNTSSPAKPVLRYFRNYGFRRMTAYSVEAQ
jgi:hypothetical protein